MQDYEKLGIVLPGPPLGPEGRQAPGRPRPLRLAGPHHPCRDHRHDRQRQDRPRHLAARGSRPRQGAGHRHRPQGRPRQPAADLPRAASGGLRALGGRAGGRGGRARPCRNSPPARRRPGARALPTGARARTASRGCGRRRTSRSTRRAARRDCRCRCSARSMRRRRRCAQTPTSTGSTSQGVVTGLLTLVGIDADPVDSREHILLSSVLDSQWQQGRNLDLGGLIGAIQNPGLGKIGVLDLESFYPSKDRFALAMRLNNLLAAPGLPGLDPGRAAGCRHAALHCRRPAPRQRHVHRPPRRCGAHVLRHAAAERDRGLDAQPVRHVVAAGHPLHGRGVRLPAARRRAAIQGAAADPAEAGPGLRPRRRARHPEPRGPGLQGAVQRGHLVHRPAADRAGPQPGSRRPAGRGAHRGARCRRASTRRWRRWASAPSSCTTCTRRPRCSCRPAGPWPTCAAR